MRVDIAFGDLGVDPNRQDGRLVCTLTEGICNVVQDLFGDENPDDFTASQLVYDLENAVMEFTIIKEIIKGVPKLVRSGGISASSTGEKSALSLAREAGVEGEKIAGITEAKFRIQSLTGTAKYRIPDELLKDVKVLREIKNVKSLSYTSQLRDFNAWAKANGYTFVLEVKEGATLSKPLLEAIENGDIVFKTLGN